MFSNRSQAQLFRPPAHWPGWVLGALMVWPWIQPWSPAPEPNTVPLLISWGCMGVLMALGQPLKPLDIARAWVLAALISSVMGLVQYFGLASAFEGALHVPPMGEANANLRQRNQLATLLGIGSMAVLWWQANGLKTRHALWMLALLAIGNAATTSRTGLLQTLLVTGLAFYGARCSRGEARHLSPRLALWTLTIYLLASMGLPQLLSAVGGLDIANALVRMGHNEGCHSRRVLWANVLELIAQKPWGGWGWGELKYAHYITPYEGSPADRFCDQLGNAHNGPLHLAVTLGVPAAVALALLLATLLLQMRPWRSRSTDQQLAWSVLAVIGLHSLLEFPLWYGPFQMALVGCGVLLIPTAQRVAWTGMLIVALVLLVGFDYARAHQIYRPPAERWAVWRDDPMAAAQSSWFFGNAATFAELTTTPVTPQNAEWVLATSLAMLHYSPEPRVVSALIQSARLLERDDLVQWHETRWRAAFPTVPLPAAPALLPSLSHQAHGQK